MTSRQRRSLRGSMDDLLGDDAEDLPVKPRSPTAGPGRAASVLRTQSGKRNLLDDDFFSKLVEEAEKDKEGSDVSEADPKALLESMKDMDDMDAELFGSKKKPSSASVLSRTSRTETSKPGDKNKTNPAGVEETKPSSAPAGTVRNYRKFSFTDDVDPLDDLLNDLDEERPKSAPSGKAGKQPASSPAGQKKEERATLEPAPKKHNELTFDDDEDDLMDAMGFSDAPKRRGSGLVANKESEAPQRPRTRLDEILGIGTSPHLLERPVTSTKKDTTPERPTQKSSASKDSVIGDEDITFGSYQPTLVSTPEGRNSRRHSVRFSTEDISSSSPERKPTSSTVTSTVTSTRPGRPASDWLGLKRDEGEKEEEEEEPTRERKESSGSLERLKPPPSPSHAGGKATRDTSKPSEELRDVPDSPETSTIAAAKPELKTKEDEDDWLAGALSKKKAQAEDRLKRQEESLGLREEIDLDTFLRKRNSIPTTRRVKEDTPLSPRQHSHESLVASSQQQSPAPAATPTIGAQHTHAPEQKPAAVSSAPVQQVSLSTDSLQQLLLQQQLAQAQLWSLGTPLDLNSLQKQRRDAEHHTGDTTTLQTRIIQLEGQVRSLQLEKDQLQMLLDNVQQRHKHDTDLMENTHRARVKLLEESAVQREAREHTEMQELMERLEAVIKQAQQERAELQEQHQRRLAQSQQERDREVERLRELQRKSILEMKKDYEEQVQRLRRLKDEEIDAVTSATSQTRSLTVVIEQMEQFSLRLGDLSSRIESTHETTTQGLDLGARQRDEQLRVLQERLTQQQRDMVEERTRLKEVIAKMDTQLVEQQRQLQQERWRVTAEQAKAESALRGLEEERRTMTQQFTIEREELERAKSALLDQQQSVMQRCSEERRKLAAEWTHFHTQEKLRKDREMDREGHIISIAQEQAELKLRAGELKQREEVLQKEREKMEKVGVDLQVERERLNTAALQLKHRVQEVECLSKLACERYDEGERALQEARQVEAGHQARLRSIRTELERLRAQEQSLQQERMRMTDHHREMDRTRHRLTTDHIPAPADRLRTGFSPVFNSTALPPPAPSNMSSTVSPKLQAALAVLKHTAEKDRDFLQDEQFFLEALKHTPCTSTLQA